MFSAKKWQRIQSRCRRTEKNSLGRITGVGRVIPLSLSVFTRDWLVTQSFLQNDAINNK